MRYPLGLAPMSWPPAPIEGTLAPWEQRLNRLISLWEMLQAYVSEFFFFGTELQNAERILWADLNPDRLPLPLEYVLGGLMTEKIIEQMRAHCEAWHLRTTLAALRTLELTIGLRTRSPESVQRQLSFVVQTATAELKGARFLYIPDSKAAQYEHPTSGWDDALRVFPEILTDVEEAVQCFALARYTACVFHLMRVAETGVQAIGKHFNLTPSAVQEPWGKIVSAVQDQVKKMPHNTLPDKNVQTTWAGVADNLYQVNLAWRIPAMHPRTPGTKYTENEAIGALGRVQALMTHLAAAI